jgi:hypothetical protein
MLNYQEANKFTRMVSGRKVTGGKAGSIAQIPFMLFNHPFMSFTAKVFPEMVQAMLGVKRGSKMPATDIGKLARFWKYPLMFAGFEMWAMKHLGITPEEERKHRPVYARSALPTSYLLMPWRNKQGNFEYLDLSYILPWGDFFRQHYSVPTATTTGGKVWEATLAHVPVSGPLGVITEAIMGKNKFFDRDLPADETWNHIYRGLTPAWTPGIPDISSVDTFKDTMARRGGSSASKFFSSVLDRPDYQNRERDLWKVGLDIIVGLKLQPSKPQAGKKNMDSMRRRAVKELRDMAIQVQMDKGMDPELKRLKKQVINEKVREVLRTKGPLHYTEYTEKLLDYINSL